MYKYIDEKGEHLHTLNGKPLVGTSSVAGVLAKPLTWWSAGLAVEKFGWINKKDEDGKFRTKEERLNNAIFKRDEIDNISNEEYLNLLDEAYSAHSKKLDSSAKAGTDLHFAIETYVKDCMKNGGKPNSLYNGLEHAKIQPFISWSCEKVKRFVWSEVNCYSERLYVGGISDIGFEDAEGRTAVLDIKSSKEAYLSQFWQCIGYAIQLEENGGLDKEGNLVFKLEKPIDYVVVFPFGMKTPEAQYYYDMENGRKAFESECFLYKLMNN